MIQNCFVKVYLSFRKKSLGYLEKILDKFYKICEYFSGIRIDFAKSLISSWVKMINSLQFFESIFLYKGTRQKTFCIGKYF